MLLMISLVFAITGINVHRLQDDEMEPIRAVARPKLNLRVKSREKENV